MEQPVKERLKQKMDERRVKIPVLAELLGIPKGRIYGWYRDNSNPKADDLQKLEKWIAGETFTKSKENVAREIEQIDIANPSLQSLIASNDKLAQANLTLADAHKIIAQNNEVLIGRLKATGENVSDNPLGHPDVLSRLLEVLAELGEGKLWKTKADGLIQLGNALSVPGFAGENKEGNRVAVGKKSTAGKAQA